MDRVPNLSSRKANAMRISETIDYSSRPDFQVVAPDFPENYFAGVWKGVFKVEHAGDYTFSCISEDGSHVWVDSNLVIDNGEEYAMKKVSSPIRLGRGYHSLRADFFKNTGGAMMVVQWKGPDTLDNFEALHGFHSPASDTSAAIQGGGGGRDGKGGTRGRGGDGTKGAGADSEGLERHGSGISGDGTEGGGANSGVLGGHGLGIGSAAGKGGRETSRGVGSRSSEVDGMNDMERAREREREREAASAAAAAMSARATTARAAQADGIPADGVPKVDGRALGVPQVHTQTHTHTHIKCVHTSPCTLLHYSLHS